MSFQRITTIGSVPAGEQRRDAVAQQTVALVLQAMDLDQVGSELLAGAQAAQRLRDLLAGRDEHVGELDRLLHRRFDAVQAELGAACSVWSTMSSSAVAST